MRGLCTVTVTQYVRKDALSDWRTIPLSSTNHWDCFAGQFTNESINVMMDDTGDNVLMMIEIHCSFVEYATEP